MTNRLYLSNHFCAFVASYMARYPHLEILHFDLGAPLHFIRCFISYRKDGKVIVTQSDGWDADSAFLLSYAEHGANTGEW